MVVYYSLGLTNQAIVVLCNACVLHACTFTTYGIQLLLVDLKTELEILDLPFRNYTYTCTCKDNIIVIMHNYVAGY